MAKILKFPQKMNKIQLFLKWLNKPREVVIKFKNKNNKTYNEKVEVLRQIAFKNKVDFHTTRIGNSIDFHPEEYAKKNVDQFINDLVRNNEIDSRYELCKKHFNTNNYEVVG